MEWISNTSKKNESYEQESGQMVLLYVENLEEKEWLKNYHLVCP